VDTHVFRICRRLGLLDGQPTPEKAQAFLESQIRPRDCHALHVHLVEHGREVCKAHHPACGECSLSALCTHARRLHLAERE
jgi:endonuclease-3